MAINLKPLEARLRECVCPSCARFTRQRTCSLPPDRECSLFKNLDKITGIVLRTHSRDIGPYAEALRQEVCAVCHFEDSHRYCPMREGVDCALDSYFPLIVDEIEQELDRQRRSVGG